MSPGKSPVVIPTVVTAIIEHNIVISGYQMNLEVILSIATWS